MLMAEQVVAEAWHSDVIGPLVPATTRRLYETPLPRNKGFFRIFQPEYPFR